MVIDLNAIHLLKMIKNKRNEYNIINILSKTVNQGPRSPIRYFLVTPFIESNIKYYFSLKLLESY